MNGLLTCTNYAFPPNALHYCGPEKQHEILAYQSEQVADDGLKKILQEFQTLYPYLTLIAYENNIRDPFDSRVVEAYWIGNDLLKNVTMKNFYQHFVKALKLPKKLKKKDFNLLVGKFDQGALPHHAFHVLNVFTRTGHHTVPHTLETMDECRIGWGELITPAVQGAHEIVSHPELDSGSILVKTKPLILQNGKLTLGPPIIKPINVPTANYQLPTASLITFHWSSLCGTITADQARNLEYYTNLAITLANNTL